MISEIEYKNEYLENIKNNLSNLCNQFKLTNNIRVYRSTFKKYYSHLQVGDIINEGIFYSTSVDKKVALEIKAKYNKDLLLIILVPKGTSCLFLGKNSHYPEDKELLLNYMLSYKIRKIIGNVMVLEVIKQ